MPSFAISPPCETWSLKEISIPNDNSVWQSTRRRQRHRRLGGEGNESQTCEGINRKSVSAPRQAPILAIGVLACDSRGAQIQHRDFRGDDEYFLESNSILDVVAPRLSLPKYFFCEPELGNGVYIYNARRMQSRPRESEKQSTTGKRNHVFNTPQFYQVNTDRTI